MRFLTVLLMYAIFSCGLYTQAQSTHVYEDSSILYPDGKIESPAVIADQEASIYTEPEADVVANESASYYIDTFIVHNRNYLSADSFQLLKADKHFVYAKNLDSLLKELKIKKIENEKKQQRERDKTRPADDISSSPSYVESIFKSTALQYFLWGLAAMFVLFVIYKLVFAEGGFRKATSASNVKVLEEDDTTPAPGKNFDSFITKAVSENNYRLAVRYLYLQLLQKLTAAGAIEFAVDKTNTEYMRELTGKPYKEAVTELTRYYDYVWYGEFEMDAALYAKVESKFKNVVI